MEAGLVVLLVDLAKLACAGIHKRAVGLQQRVGPERRRVLAVAHLARSVVDLDTVERRRIAFWRRNK